MLNAALYGPVALEPRALIRRRDDRAFEPVRTLVCSLSTLTGGKMLQHLVRGAFVFSATVALVTTTAKAEWKVEYGAKPQWVQNWYKEQKMTDETWKRLGSPSWKSCCDGGDVFKTQFRVIEDGSKYGHDTWWYLKEGVWKQVPDDVIHWGEHAPSGQATLFIRWTGQELCFYPPEEGI